MRCASCGHEATAGARFCPACGDYLQWQARTPSSGAPAGSAAPTPVPPRPTPGPHPPTGPARPARIGNGPAAPGPGPGHRPDRSGPATAAPPAARAPGTGRGTANPEVLRWRAALASVRTARAIADREGRTDLCQHLDLVRHRLLVPEFPVAVVGEFKRGKSTLVNALLLADVCPVDADVTTAVPTLVRYGPAPRALVRERDPDGTEHVTEIGPDRLAEHVADPTDQDRPRPGSVEVQLPHRLLARGVTLVDTPGVGGLGSAHGGAALGALTGVAAALLVTDASQELTEPEVDFLRQVLRRCPRAACVLTKTDLHQHWREIAARDRRHLADAGAEMPVLPVSSFLRLRARRVPGAARESGFQELFDWLGNQVVRPGLDALTRAAEQDVRFVRDQLRSGVAAEQQALASADGGHTVRSQLRADQERTGRLVATTAHWHQALTEGMQDLVSDVEHHLQRRLRALAAEVEEVIDQGDPASSWDDVGAWLERQAVDCVTATYDLLGERADALAGDVAAAFALESRQPLRLGLTPPVDSLRGLALRPVQQSQGGKVSRAMMVGRTMYFVPMASYWLLSQLGGAVLFGLGGLSVWAGVWVGRKVLGEERSRLLAHRRQQAVYEARRYLDAVSFAVTKDCRDALRRTHRQLRDEFQARAAVLHVSVEDALARSARAADLSAPQRRAREAELSALDTDLDRLEAGQPVGATTSRRDG